LDLFGIGVGVAVIGDVARCSRVPIRVAVVVTAGGGTRIAGEEGHEDRDRTSDSHHRDWTTCAAAIPTESFSFFGEGADIHVGPTMP